MNIHGLYEDRFIDVASVLLMGKRVGQFRHALHALKDAVYRVTSQGLTPRSVTRDFEHPLIAAAETDFPGKRISACVVHLCKSLIHQMQELSHCETIQQRSIVPKSRSHIYGNAACC